METVFLKDVPHAALKDLIQFMYCGEVNVKQDALPTFISTAEALQIKGLTENGDQPATPATHSATHIPIKANQTSTVQRSRTIQQRNVSRTSSYKLDSEDSSDDKAATVVVQQAQKRVIRQSAPVQQIKRVKTISADPLDDVAPKQQSTSGQQAQTIQVTTASDKSVGEPEFIDLPIETIPTKSEPDYGDDGDVDETGETEATYVEDESYGKHRHFHYFFLFMGEI